METLKLKNEKIDVQKILLECKWVHCHCLLLLWFLSLDLDNLKQLLIKQSSVEDYFLWIDNLFEQQFNEVSYFLMLDYQSVYRQWLLCKTYVM